ncbi:NupC/NupG family nucleoside CNT transporter [Rhodohalobacter sp. SW132]|uniref:NupC/NupG family nucleoside CNT transporter n=1 Tax=Rhodohalobacter sp. SW132 TaxID=2293433 RepID=UPI000E221BCF|nr:nucleoside transporter C-terminal domain-containing protein [Rhodohalobacter sp. SW132]REL38320.1 NupC/NupG family nucleoside CNT transporter [Rhodohalobacter sp. SW132]
MNIIHGIFGMIGLIGIAWLFSNNKRNVNWNLVARGMALQIGLGIFIIKGSDMGEFFAPLGWPQWVFSQISSFFVLLLGYTTEGARFIFGDLALSPGMEGSMGSFFAFQVLPTIVFFASITTILYHYGILQKIVALMAKGMRKLMGVSGAESLSVTGNIFVGQTESPLLIKPFIEGMTRSELLAVMTGGMATIAGGIMAVYIQMLGDTYAMVNEVSIEYARQMFAEQLLGASIMAAPGALVIAKIFYPEDKTPETMGDIEADVERPDENGIEAAASGATEGLKLALNVGAMLLAFIAIIAMINSFLSWFGDATTLSSIIPADDFTLDTILGWLFAPVALLIGIPLEDVLATGGLMGIKIVSTEFIAYLGLLELIEQQAIEPKTIAMATFALCGFANFASIAIQIGGIGGLAPGRKAELAEFGIKAVIAGSIVNLMNAAIAGILF